MSAATQHDRFAREDYAALAQVGIRTVRDGIRWHRIEQTPGQYTFAADLPLIRAARAAGTQVIWDICHYGWPDDLSPFEPEFGRRLAGLARAFVRLLREEGLADGASDEDRGSRSEDRESRGEGNSPGVTAAQSSILNPHPFAPFIVPINEISFLAWIGGTTGHFPPFATNRGDELKRCLVRAAIECIAAVREVAPAARICIVDPVVNVVGSGRSPDLDREAEGYRLAQYAAGDMLAGRLAPELGGRPEYLDVVGVNYYVHNQWVCAREGRFVRMLPRSDPRYRPLADLLAEVHGRYGRPLFIAETGIEGRRRPRWLRAVSDEVARARAAGVPVEGICLYPIVDYPGWADDRHCPAGLFGYPDECGQRPVYRPLLRELQRQQARFGA